MTTKDDAEGDLLCGAVRLCVVRVRERLGKGVPTLLVFRSVTPKAGNNGPVEALAMVVCLQVIRRGREVLES